MKHLPPDPLALIEPREPRAENSEAEAETRDLVESLEAIPAALRTLPWRKERLWPAVRAGLQRRPAVSHGWRWATWVSLASLLVIFSGAWWGSLLNASSSATPETRYVAQPPATAEWRVTPALARVAAAAQPRQTPLSGKTPLPQPAPAQTPNFSEVVFRGTAAPGS